MKTVILMLQISTNTGYSPKLIMFFIHTYDIMQLIAMNISKLEYQEVTAKWQGIGESEVLLLFVMYSMICNRIAMSKK